MVGSEQTIDIFPKKEIRTVAKDWASNAGYLLKEPLMIVPLLTLVPDGDQIMSVLLEGWNVFAQAERRATGEEVTITFELKCVAGKIVPDDVPREC
jgi:hypothetical protein